MTLLRASGRHFWRHPWQLFLSILGIALFFALAMEPAVGRLHARHGLSRGTATGVVFLAVAATVAVIFFLLIPGITTAADAVGARLPMLLDDLRTGLGIRIGDATTGDEAAAQLEASVRAAQRHRAARRARIRGRGSAVPGRHHRDVHVLLRR